MGPVPLESYVSRLSLSTHGLFVLPVLVLANLEYVSRDGREMYQISDPDP